MVMAKSNFGLSKKIKFKVFRSKRLVKWLIELNKNEIIATYLIRSASIFLNYFEKYTLFFIVWILWMETNSVSDFSGTEMVIKVDMQKIVIYLICLPLRYFTISIIFHS